MKKKLKSYAFWMSLTAALILVAQTLGNAFSFTVNEEVVISIVTSVIGVFVVLGLVSKKEADNKDEDSNEQNDDKTKKQ